MQPRSPEAVLAFFEAQDGLGEPWGNNDNWMTRACNFVGQPWCIMSLSLSELAAGFNPSGEILDFGTPDRPPAWADSLPQMTDLGYASTYRWGSAYVWSIVTNAGNAGRWHSDLDAGQPGDTLMVNHNGRGGARNQSSHGCKFVERKSNGRFLTWNGNIGNRVCLAEWSPNVVEGFARPAWADLSQPDPPTEREYPVEFIASSPDGRTALHFNTATRPWTRTVIRTPVALEQLAYVLGVDQDDHRLGPEDGVYGPLDQSFYDSFTDTATAAATAVGVAAPHDDGMVAAAAMLRDLPSPGARKASVAT